MADLFKKLFLFSLPTEMSTMLVQRCNMSLISKVRYTGYTFIGSKPQPYLPESSTRLTNTFFKKTFCSTVKNCREFKILGIETSCDDTSAAIVNSEGMILAEHTMNQFHLHEPMGGIVPNLALRSHTINLPTVVATTLEAANLSVTDIDIFAFTRGPGIPACLSVGTNATKTLAASLR